MDSGDGFGDRLRRAREDAGLSREELAERSGCSAKTLQIYEYQPEAPDKSRVLGGIERALGVELVPRPLFGERLRKAREDAKLTRKELAEQVNASEKTIKDYEERPKPPRYRTKMLALEHALGVELEERERTHLEAVSDPTVSQADTATLGRTLLARLSAAERDEAREAKERARHERRVTKVRQGALPLVAKLADGQGSDEERERWRVQVEHALTLSPLPTGEDSPAGGTDQDAAIEPFGGPFALGDTNAEEPIGHAEDTDGGSVQA